MITLMSDGLLFVIVSSFNGSLSAYYLVIALHAALPFRLVGLSLFPIASYIIKLMLAATASARNSFIADSQ